MEGEDLAADEALQTAAQQQQAVSCLHPVFVLSAIEAHRQFRQHHVSARSCERWGPGGGTHAQDPGKFLQRKRRRSFQAAQAQPHPETIPTLGVA